MWPDWSQLAPHRPSDPGEASYVVRPDDASGRIASWLLAGRSPLLVAGPVGIGKSTELARAAALIQGNRVVCLVPLDRFENMRRITADQVLLRVTGRLYDVAGTLGLKLSESLRQILISAGLHSPYSKERSIPPSWTAPDLAFATIREVARQAQQGRVALLIDGLEKTMDESVSGPVFEALSALREEADLVVVVPWHAAYGPGASEVIAPGERLVVIHPVAVEGAGAASGRRFLSVIAVRRLRLPSLPTDLESLVDDCATLSGGVPRTFLQLLADAAAYAKLRGSLWPSRADVRDAAADQRDSLRRQLLPGDTDALRTATGTDGRELELERKLRLLVGGLLLEHEEQGNLILRPHPLLQQLLEPPGHA